MGKDFPESERIHSSGYIQSLFFIGPQPGMGSGYFASALAHGWGSVELHATFADGGEQCAVSGQNPKGIMANRRSRAEEDERDSLVRNGVIARIQIGGLRTYKTKRAILNKKSTAR